MTQLDYVLSFLDKYIDEFSTEQIRHNRFAFWHDVGVTGLSALATALLGLGEVTGVNDYRGIVLFITASVTVFVACDHFFKFRSKADTYRLSSTTLLRLKDTLVHQTEQGLRHGGICYG